ncbi:MAG: transposase [Chloroflexota bacterium]|nr:transposase [Chloroflexota bacterium]MDE2857276.1 transposase [Chloroflexota bacterium]
MGKYRKYRPETKVRIVLEILRGEKSVAQASRDYQIKNSLLYRWKDEFLEGGRQAFAFGQATEQKRRADKIAELERMLGKLTMQLEIAKKASHYVKSLPPESGS